ncbi:RNA polymerase sigma-70 factor [Echinicola marina]|uniref:RNA polymerase sigma factor n=1 Tax=Echinicola marina TaxID=2859768 RepID=UPI001CF64E12|nr:RNA polymerase sigma-70 factor [Echinicola marina]UCS91703.1 RNA polymerase sigma-70 factor [Echinicola marina]
MSVRSPENCLISSIRNGDREAFTSFYDSYYKKVFVFVLFISKDKGLSEDIAQETFARLWEKRNQLKEIHSLKGFVRQIAKNLVNDHFRKNAIRNAYQERSVLAKDPSGTVTMETVYFNELKLVMDKALDQLPEKKREIFKLSRYEQLSYSEIAMKFGTTPKAIERHMAKSTQMIKDYLQEHAGYTVPYFIAWCVLYF